MDVSVLIRSLLAAETAEDRAEILSRYNVDLIETDVRTAGTDLSASGDASDETLGVLELLAWTMDEIDTYRTGLATLAAEQAEAAERVAAAAARFAAPAVEAEVPEVAAAVEPEAEVPAVEAEVPAEVEAAPVAAAVEEAAPEAAAPRVPAIDVLHSPEAADAAASGSKMKVTAGSDIPTKSMGAEFADIGEVAVAMAARRQALGNGYNLGAGERVIVAHVDYLDDLAQASEDPHQNTALIRQAAQPQALTASGGFCAPSETIYSFVKVNQVYDLVQDYLPTIGAPRGSIQYPDSPDIRDAFTAHPSYAYTEANDIAAVAKTVTRFACPDFITCTVEAQYEILGFGNFSTRAYPEWVEHWTGLTVDVHAHSVSAKLIAGMVALSGTAVVVGPSGGATASLLSYIGMAAADYRQDLRTGRQAQLDVLCPSYIFDQVRADLARSGAKTDLDALAVSDAQISAMFANLNVTLRPVADWQNVSANSATGTTTFPATMEVLIYLPGTFVRADMGTLDLGLVRDTVTNATNDYTIFAESFEQVCKPGIESRRYRITTCTNGEFSALANLLCNGEGPSSS